MIRVKDAELQKLRSQTKNLQNSLERTTEVIIVIVRSQTKNLQNSLERTTEVNIIIVNIEDYIVIFSCDVAAIRFKVQQVQDKAGSCHGWPNKIL